MHYNKPPLLQKASGAVTMRTGVSIGLEAAQ